MAGRIIGRRNWSMTRDSEGQREYTLVVRVEALAQDGPQVIMNTPGLPAIGSTWQVGNAPHDDWAFCDPEMIITPVVTEDVNTQWDVEQKFRTRPRFRCQDTSIANPLLEPQRVSGSYVQHTKEYTTDIHGNVIKNSSHETIKVEFDDAKPTVTIEQNVASLGIDLFDPMIDTVNSSTMWGLPAGTIKLNSVSWERKVYGSCLYYYTRVLEFYIDGDGFSRDDIVDEGRMVLNGYWSEDDDGPKTWVLKNINGNAPNPDNPLHFIRAIDSHGNPIVTRLDGAGKPFDDLGTAPAIYHDPIEGYGSSNFFTLGVPTSL